MMSVRSRRRLTGGLDDDADSVGIPASLCDVRPWAAWEAPWARDPPTTEGRRPADGPCEPAMTGSDYRRVTMSAGAHQPWRPSGGAAEGRRRSEEHRARVNRNLTRWGLSMVIIGPVVTLATMVVPFAIAG